MEQSLRNIVPENETSQKTKQPSPNISSADRENTTKASIVQHCAVSNTINLQRQRFIPRKASQTIS